MSDALVVNSKVKALVKAKELRSSDEFLGRLSEKVAAMVDAAAAKTVEAGRKTLKAEDLE